MTSATSVSAQEEILSMITSSLNSIALARENYPIRHSPPHDSNPLDYQKKGRTPSFNVTYFSACHSSSLKANLGASRGQWLFAQKFTVNFTINEIQPNESRIFLTDRDERRDKKSHALSIIVGKEESDSHTISVKSVCFEIVDGHGNLGPKCVRIEQQAHPSRLKGALKSSFYDQPLHFIVLAFAYGAAKPIIDGDTMVALLHTTNFQDMENLAKHDVFARKFCLKNEKHVAFTPAMNGFMILSRNECIQNSRRTTRPLHFENISYLFNIFISSTNATLPFDVSSLHDGSMGPAATYIIIQRSVCESPLPISIISASFKIINDTLFSPISEPLKDITAMLDAQPPPSVPVAPPPPLVSSPPPPSGSTTPPSPSSNSPASPQGSSNTSPPSTASASGSNAKSHKARYKVPWILFGLVLAVVLMCILYVKYGKFFNTVGTKTKKLCIEIGKRCLILLLKGKRKFCKKGATESQDAAALFLDLNQRQMGLSSATDSSRLANDATSLPQAMMFTNTLYDGSTARKQLTEEHSKIKKPSKEDESHLTYLPYEELPSSTASDIPSITNLLYSNASLNHLPPGEIKSNGSGSRKEGRAKFYGDHKRGNIAPNSSPNEVAGSTSPTSGQARDAHAKQMDLLDGNVDVEITSTPKTTKELIECIGKSIESTGKLIETAGKFLESDHTDYDGNPAAAEEEPPKRGDTTQEDLVHMMDVFSHSNLDKEEMEKLLASKQLSHELVDVVSKLIKSKSEENLKEFNKSRNRRRHLVKNEGPSKQSQGDVDIVNKPGASGNFKRGSPRLRNFDIQEQSKGTAPSPVKGKRKYLLERDTLQNQQGPEPSSSSAFSNTTRKNSSLRTLDRDFSSDSSQSVSPAALKGRDIGDVDHEEIDPKIVSTSAYPVDRVFSNMLYNSSGSPSRSTSPNRISKRMNNSSKISPPPGHGDVNRCDDTIELTQQKVAGSKVHSTTDDDGQQLRILSERLIDLAIGKWGFPQPGGSSPKENNEKRLTPISQSQSLGSISARPAVENSSVPAEKQKVPPAHDQEVALGNQLHGDRHKRLKRVLAEDHSVLKRRKTAAATASDHEIHNSFSRDSNLRSEEIVSSFQEKPVFAHRSRLSSKSRSKSFRRRGSLYEEPVFRRKSKAIMPSEDKLNPAGNHDDHRNPLALILYEPPADHETEEMHDHDSHVCPRFKFEDLRKATNGFANRLKITKDSSGVFYKGVLLDTNNTPVAVKVIDHTTRQRPSMDEVSDLSQLKHPHLAQLMGFCKHSLGKYYVVYEWIPGGSVDGVLFERRNFKVDAIVPWKKRFSIIQSVAQALSYLHNNEAKPIIIHRNVKANNVMFQSEKLSDYGFAWMMEHGCKQTSSLSVTIGNHGMIAPEFMASKRATTKSDVYAFGLLALELASGRRAIDQKASTAKINLADWISSLESEGRKILDAMDNNLQKLPINKLIETQVETILHLGLSCIQADPASRPSMAQVVKMLEGEAPIPDVKPEEFAASIASPITLFDVNHESTLPGDITQTKSSTAPSMEEETPSLAPITFGSKNVDVAIQDANDVILATTDLKQNKRNKRSKSLSFIKNLPSIGMVDSSSITATPSSSPELKPQSERITPSKSFQSQSVDYIPYESQSHDVNVFKVFKEPTASTIECMDDNPPDPSSSISKDESNSNVHSVSILPPNTNAQASTSASTTTTSHIPVVNFDSYSCENNTNGFKSSAEDASIHPYLGSTCTEMRSLEGLPSQTPLPKCRCHSPPCNMKCAPLNKRDPGGDTSSQLQRRRKKKVIKNRIIISGPSHIQISKSSPSLFDPLSVPTSNEYAFASPSSSSSFPSPQFQLKDSFGSPASTSNHQNWSPPRTVQNLIYITPSSSKTNNYPTPTESSALLSFTHDPPSQSEYETLNMSQYDLFHSPINYELPRELISDKVDNDALETPSSFLSSPPPPSFGDTL